jgi:hypothetical protein
MLRKGSKGERNDDNMDKWGWESNTGEWKEGNDMRNYFLCHV